MHFCKCSMPDGLVIKPDGVNELDPCLYRRKRLYTNCTRVSRCRNAVLYNINAYRTAATEEVLKKDGKMFSTFIQESKKMKCQFYGFA